MNKLGMAVAAAAVSLISGAASAATVEQTTTFQSNNCQDGLPFVYTGEGNANGNFGGDCAYLREDGVQTPLIARFDVNELNGEGQFTLSGLVLGSAFSTIDGSEFKVFQAEDKKVSFSYTPGEGDPNITVVSLKGGNVGGNAYEFSGPVFEFSGLITGTGPNGQIQGLSNIAFFDTSTGVIPLPAAAWLLLGGLGGLAALRRSKKAA